MYTCITAPRGCHLDVQQCLHPLQFLQRFVFPTRLQFLVFCVSRWLVGIVCWSHNISSEWLKLFLVKHGSALRGRSAQCRHLVAVQVLILSCETIRWLLLLLDHLSPTSLYQSTSCVFLYKLYAFCPFSSPVMLPQVHDNHQNKLANYGIQ